MYLRFVTSLRDTNDHTPLGVFAAAYRLREQAFVPEYIRAEIRETLIWFDTHLPKPSRFVDSCKPHRQDNGICWFKAEARECLRQARYLAQLVAEQDVTVQEIKSSAPGYWIYEDEFQIVVAPFRQP